MVDEEVEEELSNPDETDFHGQKRELLRKGMDEGELEWDEIIGRLTEEHLSDTELEVFLFTCDNLGIEVHGRPDTSDD